MTEKRIQEAETEAEVIDGDPDDLENQAQDFYLGDPSAFSQDCKLLHEDRGAGIPGCKASVECGNCHQLFTVDLLSDSLKICPKCDDRYTHLLVICRDDDAETAGYVVGHLFRENNQFPNQENQGDDGEDDDEQGDGEIPPAKNE